MTIRIPIFDQEDVGMAPATAREAAIIPASYGVSPDPAAAIIEASPQVELFDETRWDVPKRFFHPIAEEDPTLAGRADAQLAASVMAARARGALPVVLAADARGVAPTLPPAPAQGGERSTLLQLTARPDPAGSSRAALAAGHQVVAWGLRTASVEEAAWVDTDPAGWAGVWRHDQGAALPMPGRGTLTVAVDLSVFDSSVMAAVADPLPGGADWSEVIGILEAILPGKYDLSGLILCGLCPHPSLHAADFLAAKLLYKLLTFAIAPNDQQ